jgi:hypothetical protein
MAKVYARKRDLDQLEELLTKKLRKFKLKVSGVEASLTNIEDDISRKINEILGLKLKRLIAKNVGEAKEELSKQCMRSIENGYLDFINTIVENVISTRVDKKVRWKTRTFKMSECTVQKINDLYIKGWKICFTGKLNDKDEIIMFEKPMSNKKNKEAAKNVRK